jgi:hypothetical protein
MTQSKLDSILSEYAARLEQQAARGRAERDRTEEWAARFETLLTSVAEPLFESLKAQLEAAGHGAGVVHKAAPPKSGGTLSRSLMLRVAPRGYQGKLSDAQALLPALTIYGDLHGEKVVITETIGTPGGGGSSGGGTPYAIEKVTDKLLQSHLEHVLQRSLLG